MGQKIRVRIAGREYPIDAQTPQQENLIRLAAEAVNKMLDGYKAAHPGRSETDLMAFVALNKSIAEIAAIRQNEAANAEVESLRKDLDNYLDNIE